ncbi:class C sortase [Corynebacterium diphtheriae bv. mitis]|uniref:class C sortase n=1 Tax=Corynebacterium diphtheriae TaxID=1717 RepID=UPI0013C6BA84|nr:class C sortase [Corynebacterium diphtheriae]MBG9313577.1 class C sortase [Corynebacterium diphtheriae bv. mitis]CAB0582253.1 class C sortase [Corynebacterium diphtheriae]CAB0628085.1 class C sortase [Corynebacterium diphtheriae]CAB0719110.1 class C sortase [Corynebacterium diphtheriae]CAB0731072.1 class C sortase [Corynebacterium diphtheriae]
MAVATRQITTPNNPKQASVSRRVVVPALIILVGISVLLYPVVSTQWNNYIQRQVIEEYSSEITEAPREQLNAAVEAAREYNANSGGGPILDPWLARVSEDNQDYQHYLEQLSGLRAMSQVSIPSIDSSLPVYHGSTEEVLQKGLGHLYGTSLPVGGEGTHSVITGHTGLTTSTMWDNLVDVKEGDAIYVNTFGEKMKYQVTSTEVVLSHETESLAQQPDKDLMTLITCTPYGVNSHRLLVHAERVPLDPEDETAFDQKNRIVQWWMWALLIIALLAIAYLIHWIRKERRKAAAAQCAPADLLC